MRQPRSRPYSSSVRSRCSSEARKRLKVQDGYLIAIEGIDAAGKRTQTGLLSAWLKKTGLRTIRISFPDYGTTIGKEIRIFLSGRRAYPMQLQHMLFAANRWEKSDSIKAHLRAGAIVVVNRYTESNLAYGKANGLEVDWLANLERGIPPADLVIVLDASPVSLESRRPAATKDAYEKSARLQRDAQNAYRELAASRGWRLVDANRPTTDVHGAVVKVVEEAIARDRRISI